MSTSTVSMIQRRTRSTATKGRMPLFYAVTAAFLGFLVLALNEPMQFSYFAWTAGYENPTHRVHHVMIGSLLTLFVIGVAVQLYRPMSRVGAYLLAALIVGSIVIMTLIGEGLAALAELGIFVIPLAIIGLLHPGLRSFRLSRESLDVRMLALAVVVAVPLLAFAAYQMNLHLTLTDDHVVFEHYLMMASGTVAVALGALVASFRPAGWRVLAYGVALLLALVSIASVAFPESAQGVNFGVAGGSLAVLWAVAFIAVAEYSARKTDAADATESVAP